MQSVCTENSVWVQFLRGTLYITTQYDTVYLTCSKKLTSSHLSLSLDFHCYHHRNHNHHHQHHHHHHHQHHQHHHHQHHHHHHHHHAAITRHTWEAAAAVTRVEALAPILVS